MTGTNVATLYRGASLQGVSFTPAQLQIIKTSVAPGLIGHEFDLFIEQARLYGLSPIKKQIYGIIYMRRVKNDATNAWESERQLTLITSIQGLRTIAARTGKYRPDDRATRYTKAEKTPANPAGIESAEVTVYTQDSSGEWYPAIGVADWDEFAPIHGKKGTPTGKWGDMPKLMLAKCAEAQALRRAFPDDIGSLYEQSEMDQAEGEKWTDATATEIVEAQEILDRRAIVGDKHIRIMWNPMGEQEAIPASKLHGRLIDFYRDEEAITSPDQLEWFTRCNRESLKEFWAERPDEALEAKREREAAAERLST